MAVAVTARQHESKCGSVWLRQRENGSKTTGFHEAENGALAKRVADTAAYHPERKETDVM